MRQALTFAGRPALLDVVGRSLSERLVPTFAHLTATSTGTRPITVSIWDEAVTGLEAPSLSDPAELEWRRDDWLLSSHADHRCLREARAGRVGCLDRQTDHLVIAYASASGVSLHEQGRPAARLLAQIYRGLGVTRVHAGLVAAGEDGEAGALVVGRSGSGKTTLTLDCLTGGLDYLADDVVGIEQAGDERFIGHSIYGCANVLPFHLDRHPDLRPYARSDTSQDKALLLAAQPHPHAVRARTTLRAILVPRVSSGARTRLTPFARRDVLPMLVPDTPEHVHAGFSERDAARLAALVKRTRCYLIEPGRDPREVAASVRAFLEHPPA